MTSPVPYGGYEQRRADMWSAAGTRANLIVPPKTRKYRCCSYTTTLMSYLLVAYMSADATLMACLKTNCSEPSDTPTIKANSTIINLHDNNSMTFLIISESIAGILLLLIIISKWYQACKAAKYTDST